MFYVHNKIIVTMILLCTCISLMITVIIKEMHNHYGTILCTYVQITEYYTINLPLLGKLEDRLLYYVLIDQVIDIN